MLFLGCVFRRACALLCPRARERAVAPGSGARPSAMVPLALLQLLPGVHGNIAGGCRPQATEAPPQRPAGASRQSPPSRRRASAPTSSGCRASGRTRTRRPPTPTRPACASAEEKRLRGFKQKKVPALRGRVHIPLRVELRGREPGPQGIPAGVQGAHPRLRQGPEADTKQNAEQTVKQSTSFRSLSPWRCPASSSAPPAWRTTALARSSFPFSLSRSLFFSFLSLSLARSLFSTCAEELAARSQLAARSLHARSSLHAARARSTLHAARARCTLAARSLHARSTLATCCTLAARARCTLAGEKEKKLAAPRLAAPRLAAPCLLHLALQHLAL